MIFKSLFMQTIHKSGSPKPEAIWVFTEEAQRASFYKEDIRVVIVLKLPYLAYPAGML